MSRQPSATGDSDNTDYKIRRTPDLQVVTPKAKIRYLCEWVAPGAQPQTASGNYWGPRDGIRWYTYGDQPPTGSAQRQIKVGPLDPYWDRVWREEPGHYTVVAEIRSRLAAPGTAPTYCYRSQQVGPVGAMMKDWLDKLEKKGIGPSPDDAEREIGRYRKLLDDIAKKLPPTEPTSAQKHKETVDKWREIAGRLRGLLAPSDKKNRIPLRAIHLESATQARRPLFLFLVDMGEVSHVVPRMGVVSKKHWVLVDWTDPGDPRFRGNYDGEGSTAREAIQACLSNWDWSNRYPEGHVTFDIPVDLRGLLGHPARRQMDTNGKGLTDELIVVFEWIAIGSMLVAGFCFIFVGIPALTSAAMATSMLATTAGATFSVGQRWRDGIFDWKADAIDGLTVVGNLVGTGVWTRGQRVCLMGQAGKKLDFVFLGARVGTDAAQGILIVDSRMSDLDRLMKDPSYPPEERARKMLALFAELTAVGLLTAVSFKASAKEAENLSAKPRHLKDEARANIPEERLRDLTDPDKRWDTTAPPVLEGHTKEGKQKTVVNTGVKPLRKVSQPEETDFALAYPPDSEKWAIRRFNKSTIHLLDHDGFQFKAHCEDGVLDITIVTKQDGKYSKHLVAKELYPKMYAHFEQLENPVTELKGLWAWDNYAAAKKKLDELLAAGVPEAEALKEAVLNATTHIKYHQRMGFTKVVSAQHFPALKTFSFDIVRPDS